MQEFLEAATIFPCTTQAGAKPQRQAPLVQWLLLLLTKSLSRAFSAKEMFKVFLFISCRDFLERHTFFFFYRFQKESAKMHSVKSKSIDV